MHGSTPPEREHDILSAAVARATLPGMQQPTMFAHDRTTIFYPTAPGRVYMIAIAALADCDGSDEDYSDSTATGDLSDLMAAANAHGCSLQAVGDAPETWPSNQLETIAEINEDFADTVEQWADWCDRDSARLDSLDGIMAAAAAA